MGAFVPVWLVLPRCEATNLGVFDLRHVAPLKCQQFTYGVVSEGFLAESLWKFCGKFAKICKDTFIASGKGAEIPRKVAEISRKFAENVLQ